ncbi:PRC-barrel domain-containing protein [Hyphomicrobium sp. 1Nfss2.1]|jgi:hypothetical protein|uniref:PRC-barrel domain-containing protein n=1 Tax=unclassified Hyphomicrobium TaxID=2619925 RepID=UPI000930339B|nr:PRC-barrel domain-containing protein [Hyphomicrobium sp. NDB2Meth4]
MQKFIATAALIAALSAPALAQTATSPAVQEPNNAAAETIAEKMASPAAGDISANKLINESVKNAANESIGDINDVLISTDGKVAAVIVGVGGFLGLGEKDVALPFDQLRFAKASDGKLTVSTGMTKAALESAPQYVKPENRS